MANGKYVSAFSQLRAGPWGGGCPPVIDGSLTVLEQPRGGMEACRILVL